MDEKKARRVHACTTPKLKQNQTKTYPPPKKNYTGGRLRVERRRIRGGRSSSGGEGGCGRGAAGLPAVAGGGGGRGVERPPAGVGRGRFSPGGPSCGLSQGEFSCLVSVWMYGVTYIFLFIYTYTCEYSFLAFHASPPTCPSFPSYTPTTLNNNTKAHIAVHASPSPPSLSPPQHPPPPPPPPQRGPHPYPPT